jgi:hypothetical protein
VSNFTFIVTKNNSDYVNWQTDILYESFLRYHKNDKNFKFLALVSKDHEYKYEPKYEYIYFDHIYEIHGDNYIVYNRIATLLNYLKGITPNKNNFIILLDPDFIFAKKFNFTISEEIAGQNYSYLSNDEVIDFFIQNYNQDENIKKFYKSIGCPIIVNEEFLSKIVNRWLELTIQFRNCNIKKSPFFRNWVCEMYGLAFAAAEQKTDIKSINMAGCLPFSSNSRKYHFYHYCYDIPSKNDPNKLIFSKRKFNHRLLKQIEYDKNDVNNSCLDFIEKMNHYIEILNIEKEHREFLLKNKIIQPKIISCE